MKRYAYLLIATLVVLVGTTPSLEAQESVLPTPLYYLDSAGLVSRLEMDGTTTEQVTLDVLPVDSFDVGPQGELVYVAGNNLVLLVAPETEPQVLVEGEALTVDEYGYPVLEDVLTKQIRQPNFSPDGTQIAYGLGGINIYDLSTDSSSLILPNGEPDAQAPTDEPFGARIRNPHKWAPEGETLVVLSAWIPEGTNFGLLDVANGEFQDLLNDEGLVFCCGTVYFNDADTMLYSAATAIYPGEAGLWEVDLTAQSVTNLTSQFYEAASGAETPEFHAAKLLDDGKVYFFFNVVDFETIDSEFVNSKRLYRANPDGSAFEVVNSTPIENLDQVLWAPDGSGAVVSSFVPGEGGGQELFWVPVNGGDVISLVAGSSPQWAVAP